MAMYNITSALDDLLQNKLQKMRQPSMNSVISEGTQPNYSLEYTPSRSFNARDFMQIGNQDAVSRSLGKTPLSFPPFQMQNQNVQQQNNPPLSIMEKPMASEAPAMREPILNELPEDKRHRLALEKEEHKAQLSREKEERSYKNARQLQIDKETLPFYKKVKEVSATIPEVDARLDEMEQLLDTGKVQWFGFLDSLSQAPYIGPFAGAIEQAFLTTESQVFKKLSTDFLRDAKPYFGTNMSTREVELFLQRVPSLMLTNEGNRALIRNFRSLNDYSKEVDKILEGIIAENGGERPRHLESKLQARLKPATEKLRKSFRDSVKLIPQSDLNKSKPIGAKSRA